MEARGGSPRRRPARLAAALLRWYARVKRDWPWRRRRDPWAVWISEVMLQQTRAEVVAARFEDFLARYPTPEALAEAGDDELLAAWSGLGYYRRARLMRAAARRLVAEHGGRVPNDPELLAALPGIGPYTKGAILAIAFDRPEPAIDGNVERVAARFLAIDGDPKSAAGRRRIEDFCRGLLAHGRPRDLVQALMELGARLCRPRNPHCGDCPWERDCRARARGLTAQLPRRRARRTPIEVRTALFVAHRGGRFLCRRLPRGTINEGQLTLPGPGMPAPEAAPERWLAETFGAGWRAGPLLGRFRHSITHHRIEVEVRRLHMPRNHRPPADYGFAPAAADLPWTTASRKALALALGVAGA